MIGFGIQNSDLWINLALLIWDKFSKQCFEDFFIDFREYFSRKVAENHLFHEHIYSNIRPKFDLQK